MVNRLESNVGPQQAPIVMAQKGAVQVTVLDVRAGTEKKDVLTNRERDDLGNAAVTVATENIESDPANRELNEEAKKELIKIEAQRLMARLREVCTQSKVSQYRELDSVK